jgi:hypothetical protein
LGEITMRLAYTAIAVAISFTPTCTNALAQTAADDWRSFRGDIAKWTGIPPLPRSATRTKIASAVNCTVADAAGNMVSWFMSRSDCIRWIEGAKELAKSAPTPRQMYSYRIHQCMQKFSGQVQAYSGEFYTACARSVPVPR